MGVMTPWYEEPFRRLEQITNEPEKFVAPDSNLQNDLRVLLKVMYDDAEGLDQYGPLPELIVDGLDAEQIWEEIELRTEPLVDRVQQCVADYQAASERGRIQKQQTSTQETIDRDMDSVDEKGSNEDDVCDDEMDGSEPEGDEEMADQEMPLSEDDAGERSDPLSAKANGEGVEDDFFNVDDMEGFADQMERLDETEDEKGSDASEDDDDEPVDLLHDIKGDAGTQYDGMFDDAKKASATASDDAKKASATASDDDEFAGLSEFKKRQLRLQKEIEQLEERNLNGRPWELMGEAKATDRPADALIDAELDFEMADKQPVMITQEVTNDLEDLIRQRIKDKAYDDVERKAEPVARPFRARSELETEKSEVGLAELYEKEYVEKAAGVSEAEQQLSKEHKEIGSMFAALCYKLDALSNFHFTPKPAREEVIVRKNVAAIAMEEAIPVAVSTAQAVAPEEIYKRNRHEPVAETELSREEKKARRRSKKDKNQKQREQKTAEDDLRSKHDSRFKAKREQKLALEQIKANSKIKSGVSDQDATEYTRSGTFFKKIQDAESRRGQAPDADSHNRTTKSSSASFKL